MLATFVYTCRGIDRSQTMVLCCAAADGWTYERASIEAHWRAREIFYFKIMNLLFK